MIAEEPLRCWTCGRPVKVVHLSRSMPEAFGHVDVRRGGDKHPVIRLMASPARLAIAARNAGAPATGLRWEPEGDSRSLTGTHDRRSAGSKSHAGHSNQPSARGVTSRGLPPLRPHASR